MRISTHASRRPAAILIKFVILLPVLFAWVGLVIDTGYLLATRRQAQNAADSAALAAAMDLLKIRQGTQGAFDLQASAHYYAEQNGMGTPAQVDVYHPPATGPYTGDDNYVEVVITKPLRTWFIQVVGANPNQQVVARAVAGLESIPQKDVLVVLDPNPGKNLNQQLPGLAVGGGGTVLVNGAIRVNAEGVNAVSPGSQPGKATGIYAKDLTVVGEVQTQGPDGTSQIWNIDSYPNQVPLESVKTGDLPTPDPFAALATPTFGTGVVNQYYGDVSPNPAAGQTITLEPGIYSSIQITGGQGTVVFNPGIYVLQPTKQHALVINNGPTVIGNGVMFYNTGSDYNPNSGFPDANDGSALGSTSANFGDVSITTQNLTLTPYTNPASPFNGMLFYQRRWNTQEFDVTGNGSNVSISGTIYDKWGAVKLAGSGASYNSPFIVGSISVSGTALLNAANSQTTTGYQVYLVE